MLSAKVTTMSSSPLIGLILLLLVALGLALILIFETWMAVSAILNDKLKTETKLLWVLGMLLLHPFIAIWYYFAEYRKQ
ncbi:MAG TPA: hypothetical protein VIH90_02775 [Candidatus Saccharimonadales bacterium]